VEVDEMAVEDRRDGEGDASSEPQHERDADAPPVPSAELRTGLREPQDERNRASDGEKDGGSSGRRKSKKGIGGPKTAAGKAIVARNAVKHGVLAQTPVIAGIEREEDWQRLRQGVLEFFELEGPFFEALGDQVAAAVWRLYRVIRFETEAIRQYIEDVPADWYASMRLEGRTVGGGPTKEDVEEMNRMMLSRLLPGDETMDKVMRYETRVHRFLLQKIYLIMVMKGLKKTRVSRFWGLPDLNDPEISQNMGMPPSPGS
jgi:hypothetical protein